MYVMDERSGNRAYTECQGDSWDEPTRSNDLAQHVARNLEDDVRDVKDGEDFVVVVAFETQVFLETCQSCIAFDNSVSW